MNPKGKHQSPGAWLSEMLVEHTANGFYGKITITYEKGTPVHIKVEKSLLPTSQPTKAPPKLGV